MTIYINSVFQKPIPRHMCDLKRNGNVSDGFKIRMEGDDFLSKQTVDIDIFDRVSDINT